MSISNKYQNLSSKLGISLNKGYTYDLTPSVKKTNSMDLFYSKDLYNDKLSIDVDPNNREVLYISDKSIPQSMTSNFLGKFGFDNGLYYRYNFKSPGKSIFNNIMSEGWTVETILNFNNTPTSDFSVFYYLGVNFELEEIDGQLVDTSRNYPLDFLHNNLAFAFDKNKSIIVRSARYTEECYGCEETAEVYATADCGNESSVTTNSGTLVTGSTQYEHAFNKPVCSDDESDFLITIKFERGNNILNNMCTELGTKFIESESERLGTLKIYINGLLYGTIENFEDIITRKADIPVHEFMQGWGFSDNFDIFTDYDMMGFFSGKQPRGRFHGSPLTLEEIRHNYEILKECYNITDCHTPGCGPNFPLREISNC
jgi:hypothetical protein